MLKTKDGYAKVIGTSYQGSSDYVLLSNGGSKAISSLSVNYANNAGNADKLDGEHASSFVRAGHYESADLNKLDTYSFIKSVNSNNKDTSPKGNIGWYNVIQAVHRNGTDDGPSYIGQIALGMTTNTNDMFFRGKRTDPWKTVIHSGNIGSQSVAYASKAGSVAWDNVTGKPTIPNPTDYYWANIKVSASSSTTTSPTVHTLTATRVCAGHNPGIDNSISCSNWFRSSGNTGWYNTTYLGGWYMSDTSWIRAHNDVGIYTGGQIYSSNSIRMSDIYLEHTNEINSASDLYLNYRYSSNVSLCQGGGAVIIGHTPDNIGNNKLYVNGPTTLNNVATFNGLVTNNGGILPASYNVNKNNIGCYVWGDAMSTGVTAITDALDPKYVSVHYSNDNGASWTNFNFNSSSIFSLYANNGSKGDNFYLGHQGVAESLTQVQKNQLMVTFEIPSTMYSALCWASIDIDQGVQTVCTVEIIAKDGTIKNTFTKNLFGWNSLNYINFWGNNSPVINIGHDVTGKFVRFKFKHDAGNTDVRNASIRKIRLFSFTKYVLNINDPCSLMAYTGHLYTYDQNLNVKFPNALNVGGTLTITPTSNGYYEEANYPGAVIDTYYNNNYLQIGKSNGELILDTNSDKGNINPALYIKDFVSTNRLFKFNTGLAVPPVHLMNAFNADATTTIQGEKYNAYYVGTQGNAIGKSFILADNSIDYKQVIVIRKGVDGEVCFIKDADKGIFRYYLQNTNLMLAGDQTIQRSGTFSTGFDDGKARFIIYSERNNTWFEFYCG